MVDQVSTLPPFTLLCPNARSLLAKLMEETTKKRRRVGPQRALVRRTTERDAFHTIDLATGAAFTTSKLRLCGCSLSTQCLLFSTWEEDAQKHAVIALSNDRTELSYLSDLLGVELTSRAQVNQQYKR